ncbi:MAG: formate dehydrogenase accessory protein FdhE [Acidilobaceae archaeon]|nr:formate dehydrogenase accessory protein FdhE [Acidilobaceae archaeon]
MGLIESFCAEDRKCGEELGGLLRSFVELDEKLGAVDLSVPLDSPIPLVPSLPDEILSEAASRLLEALKELGYELEREAVERGFRGLPSNEASSFASLAFRRLVYKAARSSGHRAVSQRWDGPFCPVCGLVPIALVAEEGRARYKCLCGRSWESQGIACPQCKSRDLSSRPVGKLTAYSCRNCGHMMLAASALELEGEAEEEFLPLLAASALSAGGGI